MPLQGLVLQEITAPSVGMAGECDERHSVASTGQICTGNRRKGPLIAQPTGECLHLHAEALGGAFGHMHHQQLTISVPGRASTQ